MYQYVAPTPVPDITEQEIEVLSSVNHRLALRLWNAGNSYKKIADITGVSLGTVKSRISRARQKVARSRDVLAMGSSEHGAQAVSKTVPR